MYRYQTIKPSKDFLTDWELVGESFEEEGVRFRKLVGSNHFMLGDDGPNLDSTEMFIHANLNNASANFQVIQKYGVQVPPPGIDQQNKPYSTDYLPEIVFTGHLRSRASSDIKIVVADFDQVDDDDNDPGFQASVFKGEFSKKHLIDVGQRKVRVSVTVGEVSTTSLFFSKDYGDYDSVDCTISKNAMYRLVEQVQSGLFNRIDLSFFMTECRFVESPFAGHWPEIEHLPSYLLPQMERFPLAEVCRFELSNEGLYDPANQPEDDDESDGFKAEVSEKLALLPKIVSDLSNSIVWLKRGFAALVSINLLLLVWMLT